MTASRKGGGSVSPCEGRCRPLATIGVAPSRRTSSCRDDRPHELAAGTDEQLHPHGTEDLNADFPAVAARAIGLDDVPLLCTRELDVPARWAG